MKMQTKLKKIFYFTFLLLFLTGVFYFAIEIFSSSQDDLNNPFSRTKMWTLRSHSILGLWFFFLFGHLYSKHIGPKLRRDKGKKSGLVFFASLIIVCITVPGLFYITDDHLRDGVAKLHTYLGIALIIPFLLHSIFKIDSKSKR